MEGRNYLQELREGRITISDIPKDKRDRNICLEAVHQNGLSVKYVPDTVENYREICLSAVQQKGFALYFVSDLIKNDREICLAAVKQDPEAMDFVSDHLKNDPEFCLTAVKLHPMALEFVSDTLKNYPEICLTAVKLNPMALKFVSDTLKNYREICLAAVKLHSLALQFVSDLLKNDRNFCLVAVQYHGLALSLLPDIWKSDQEICFAAVQQNGLALQFVSDIILKNDRKFCLSAVQQNGLALQFVPDIVENYREICLAAVQQNGLALQFVSDIILKNDRKFCLSAVQQNGLALQFVPDLLKNDPEFYLAALRQNYRAFEYVPQNLRRIILQSYPDILEKMLRNSYDPNFFLTPDDQKALDGDLNNIYEKILITCQIVILQPKATDYELEDIQQVYAYKHGDYKYGEARAICVRNIDQLSVTLEKISKLDNKEVNFVLVGHTSAIADNIAEMSASQIALFAKKYPIIKKITLAGCRTGWSEDLLEEERENVTTLGMQKEDLREQIKKTFPDIFSGQKEKANATRLDALVNDMIWHNGDRFCGTVAILDEGETTDEKMKKILDPSLDACYVLVKNKQTGNVAVYYLERDIERDKNGVICGAPQISCHLISRELTNDQIEALKNIKELSTGPKGNKQHLISPLVEGWCANKNGKVAVLTNTTVLSALSNILNHTRDIHFSELPQLWGRKRIYQRSIEISSDPESEDFKKMVASLTGKVAKALRLLFQDQPSKTPTVKGFSDLVYPGKKGLVTTGSLKALKKVHNQILFGATTDNLNPEIKKNLETTDKSKSKIIKHG